MRFVLATILAVTMLGPAAIAQTSPQGAGSSNPAVNMKPAGSPQSTGAIEPGANSFTEGQARSRMEAQGFMNVSDLKKDDQGIWRGKAMRDGKTVTVSLDFRGNVAAQ